MAFGDLLEQVGSTGRFQVLHVTLLCTPVLLMASHNMLQNFVAAVPPHYCSAHANLSQLKLSPQEILTVTVPLDQTGKHQSCQRYVAPQWHLLGKNGTLEQEAPEDIDVEISLQGCTDGWSYNMTGMTSTIVAEVRPGFLVPPGFPVSAWVLKTFLNGVFSGIWCAICAL